MGSEHVGQVVVTVDDPAVEVGGPVVVQPSTHPVDPGKVRAAIAVKRRVGLQLAPPPSDLPLQPAVRVSEVGQPHFLRRNQGQGGDGVDHRQAKAVPPVGVCGVPARQRAHRGEAVYG